MTRSPIDALKRWSGLARSLRIYWWPGRQKPLRKLYGSYIQPGDLVFDIGAHVGDRTAAFASLGAQVVALEPQPQFQCILGWLFRRNPRVRILPEAVGERPGTAQLALSYSHPTVASLASHWRRQLQQTSPGFRSVHWERSITVAVTSLDELIRSHGEPVFCKIDVEGYEAQVLAGLSTPLAALSFEFVDGALEQAQLCLDQLERLGRYQFNAIAGEERVYRWPRWQRSDAIRQWLAGGADGLASGDIYARRIAPRDGSTKATRPSAAG